MSKAVELADSEMDTIDDAKTWEMAFVLLHFLTYVAVGAFGYFKIGWAGLWWQLLGGLWAITLLTGLVRSVKRRLA